MSTIRNAALGVSLTIALVAAACGGDTDVETTGQAEDGTVGGDGTDDTTDDTTDTTDDVNDNAECGAGNVDFDDPCEVCIASKCTAEALECCQAEGCLDVVRCAAETGCNGIDCYAPDKCKDEIDAAGIDVAQTKAQALGTCALENCPVECEQETGGM